MREKKIATSYYCEGGYYLNLTGLGGLSTEADLCRKLHTLGYTHYRIQHARRKEGGVLEKNLGIPTSHPRRIPKMYRVGEVIPDCER